MKTCATHVTTNRRKLIQFFSRFRFILTVSQSKPYNSILPSKCFQTEAAAANAIKLNDSEFKGRQLKVTSKRVNQPGFYVQQAAAAAVAAGIDPSALAYVGGRGYGRGGRGGPPFRGGRGGGFRGGGRGGHFPRGGGGRGGGFRGGGRASGYHPYY